MIYTLYTQYSTLLEHVGIGLPSPETIVSHDSLQQFASNTVPASGVLIC